MNTPVLTDIPEVGDQLDPQTLIASATQLRWWPKGSKIYCSEFLVDTLTYADIAIERRMVIGLYGPAGAGKSVAYELIMALAAGRGLAPVPMRLAAGSSAKGAAEKIGERVGVATTGLSRAKILNGLAVTLAQRPRMLGFDESQELDRVGLETERAVWEEDSADCAMVLAGAHLAEKLELYPALKSRVLVPRHFVHLTGGELHEHLRGTYPQLADVEDHLLNQMDAVFAHGNLREWASTMIYAQHFGDLNQPLDTEIAVACLKAACGQSEKFVRTQMAKARP